MHPLALDDLFDGVRAVKSKVHATIEVKHELSPDEYEHQKKTRPL